MRLKIIKLIMMLITFEVVMSLLRSQRRKTQWIKANEQNKKTNKQLLVIGNPNNGGWSSVIGAEYGCGNICTDLIGCPKCPSSIKGDLLNVLKQFSSNSVVIYESCVLEYIKNIDEVKQEMLRVSGGDIFSVRIGFTLMNIYYFPSLWTNEPQIVNMLSK